MPLINVGDRWGMLTILAKDCRREVCMIAVKCDCGVVRQIRQSTFYGKYKPQSCGCNTSKQISKARTSHGCSTKNNTPEFRTFICWQSMLWRCYNKNRKDYPRYGGRGITVCARWLESFENFRADMGLKPEGLTIGRKNNDIGYCPSNCEWQTQKQQQNNKASNHYIKFGATTKTLMQWSEIFGLPKDTLRLRIESGWTLREAFYTPLRKMKNNRQIEGVQL